MKHILGFAFFICISQLFAQLPYTLNNICLDRIRDLNTPPINIGSSKNLIVRDFNNDNFDDVLEADYVGGVVNIYQNNSGTGFTKTQILVGFGINKFGSATVGDFNGDNILDIALAYVDSIFIFAGNGGFSFPTSPVCKFKLNGYICTPGLLKAAKLNNDNLDDLVLVAKNTSSLTNGIGIIVFRTAFTGPSSYTFFPDYTKQGFQSAAPLSTVNCNVDFSFGDIDNDTKKDVFITYSTKQDCVLILKSGPNNTNLSFIAVSAYKPIPIQTFSVTFGACKLEDVNHDNFADLVTVTKASNGFVVLQGFAVVFGAPAVVAQPTIQPNLGQTIITYSGVISSPAGLINDFDFLDINQDGYKDLFGINDGNLYIYFWDKAAGIFDQTGGLIIPVPNLFADQLVTGNFDNNNLRDLYFKSWGTLFGKPGVIPNFTFRYNDTIPGSKLYCPGGNPVITNFNTMPLMTLPVGNPANHSVDWYKVAGPPDTYYGSGANLGITSTGSFYPVFTFTFPALPTATCSIKHLPKDTVYVKPAPGPTVSIFPVNPPVCPGGTVSLSALAGTLVPSNYTWTTPSGTVPNVTSVIASPTTTSAYTVKVRDSNGCRDSTSTNVSVYPPDQGVIFTPSTSICTGDSANLSLTALTYSWSTGSTLSSIYVKPPTNSVYTVTITDLNTCVSTKTIAITVDGVCHIKIYTTVSPNGDFINDVFTIDNINRYPNNKVQIFNRWGASLYYQEGYDNVSKFWPAQNSNYAPSTYYYVVDLGDGSPKIKGWLEVISN